MRIAETPIRPNEIGAYGELVARPNPNGLIILNEPPIDGKLSVISFNLHRALTWQEIVGERDRAPAIVLTRMEAEQLLAARAKRGLC